MVLCTVRWSRSVDSGFHEIGARFDKIKPETPKLTGKPQVTPTTGG
jgi:hypothetical protein